MKINSITMNHFGKFKDYSLSFEDGFNVLYGENEQGKSTIMAFIRMMLYGSATREKDLSKNIRRKYTPWDGSKMSGSMEFSHEGICYRIEKTFGATPKNDVVKLWNQSTNETEQLTEQRDIGRRFFGMGEEAFEKSVFIGQIASVINPDKEKENEIIQKLQNLASSGDETQSFHLIESRLLSAAEKIRSKGGKIGVLDRLKQARIRLEDEKSDAIAMETEKDRMQRAYQNLLDQKAQEAKMLEEKNNAFEEIRQYKKYRELQQILIKSSEIENLMKEWNEANELLVHDDFKIDSTFIGELKKQLQELIYLQTILQNRNDELSEREESIKGFGGNEIIAISKEEFETVQERHKQILAEQEQITTMQFSLQQEEFAWNNAVSYENTLQEIRLKTEEYQNQIKQLKSVLEQRLPEEQKKIRFPLAGCLAGIAFLLLFFLAGYLIHPLFYSGGIIPAILLPAFLIRYSKKRKKQQEDDYTIQETIKEKTNQIHTSISFYQKQWDELEEKQETIRQNRRNKENADPRFSADIRLAAEKIKDRLEETKKTLEAGKAEMSEIFTRFQVSSFDRLQENYFENQNRLNQKTDAIRKINEKKEYISVQQRELKMKLQAFAGNFNKGIMSLNPEFSRLLELLVEQEKEKEKETTDDFLAKTKNLLETAKELIEELASQLNSASNLIFILEEKKKDLQAALANRSISIVRQELETIASRFDKGELRLLEQEPSDAEIAALEKQIETLADNRNSTAIAIAQMKSEMLQTFLDKPELSAIEDQILLNEKQQRDSLARHTALSLAKTQLEQAFLEMQQTFGPIVNKKTAEIFSRITNGKYQELLVSKDLNISFRDPFMNTTQDWQYLSGGTIDQVYFSLRLAISGFWADQAGGLPLFIDDAFLQYDDSRTKQSMMFLEDYSSIQKAQILLFTCHRNLYEHSGANTTKMDLSALETAKGQTGETAKCPDA